MRETDDGGRATFTSIFPGCYPGRRAHLHDGHAAGVRNLSGLSLEDDGVFGDGHDRRPATMSGGATDGHTAELTAPV
ncbi:hypothetical protein ACIQU3_10985 [Streptomyces sp. NPDC101110]|uniref:hypothetical protein n=1 Tax=Streptomyces sp. NPDC101110 TaxID=3366104 RepID=UPI0038030722